MNVFKKRIDYYTINALFYCFIYLLCRANFSTADYPWTFDNDLFGGPDFWGLVNKHWKLCTSGQLQSPINIDPTVLLYDSNLKPLQMESGQIEGLLKNTGQLPVININNSLANSMKYINITQSPASPYNYRLQKIIFHTGRIDTGEKGSEHTIDKIRYPAEVQMLAYNVDLYDNFTDALTKPRGILAISVIVDIGKRTNSELRKLSVASQSIIYKGQSVKLRKLNPAELLPKTLNFITYEGSLTFPGCYETATWVVMNNPIYITREDLEIWNTIQQTETKQANPTFMSPNYRPLKPVNKRLLRTNIHIGGGESNICKEGALPNLAYKVNPRREVEKIT
uniref:Alpha-carbonic anhydrase domain-containing protein n=1 Tax=Rhabditophanes sp. KR3021 TaxID=114890 RepID=A0AC35U4X9_9BILA